MMIAFAVAILAVYALNSYAASKERPRFVDAQGCAGLLALSYGLSTALVEVYGMPSAVLGYPIMDLALCWMVMRAWYRQPRVWKLILAALLVSQLTAHAGFVMAWHNGVATTGGLRQYAEFVNVTFGLQLLTVGSSGAAYVLGRIIHSLLDRRRAVLVPHGR